MKHFLLTSILVTTATLWTADNFDNWQPEYPYPNVPQVKQAPSYLQTPIDQGTPSPKARTPTPPLLEPILGPLTTPESTPLPPDLPSPTSSVPVPAPAPVISPTPVSIPNSPSIAPVAPPNPSPAVAPQAPAPFPIRNAGRPPGPKPTIPSTSITEDDQRTVLINFNNVSMVEFIRFVSRVTGRNFIFNESDLYFNVTIVSEEPTTIDNLMAALLQELRIRGFLLLEQGNNLVIHNNSQVVGISRVEADGIPPSESNTPSELVTRVFRLNTFPAERAYNILLPLISSSGIIEAALESNHLVVTDLTSNVDKIALLLKSLDSPVGGLTIGQYVATNGLLVSLVELAKEIMEPMAEGKIVKFVEHNATNSVFVVSTPYLVERSLAVLAALDANYAQTRMYDQNSLTLEQMLQMDRGPGALGPGRGGKLGTGADWSSDLPLGSIQRTQFRIYKLRYRRGDQIVTALQNISQSLQQIGNTNPDLVVAIDSVQWIEATNSLIFTGPSEALDKIQKLIEEIDIALRQVFLEVLILETTLDDSLQYGVNWGARFGEENFAGAEAFLSKASTLPAVLNSANPGNTPDASSLAATNGYNLGIVGRHIFHGGVAFNSIGALVSALHEKGKSDIIMNPKLLAEDNATAEIFVGINTKFKTQSISNDQGTVITNNFEFRDIGTLIRITPLLSNNDIITLQIEEEVSSLAPDVSSGGNSLSTEDPGPSTRTSRTRTRVHIPDRFFLIISGMMQDDLRRIRNQVPCLGSVPLLGAAFSEKRYLMARRNLMIFIRPQIIDTDSQIDELVRHQQNIWRTKRRSRKMWKLETDEALDFFNIKDSWNCEDDYQQHNP